MLFEFRRQKWNFGKQVWHRKLAERLHFLHFYNFYIECKYSKNVYEVSKSCAEAAQKCAHIGISKCATSLN